MAGTEANTTIFEITGGPIQDPRSQVTGEQRTEPNVEAPSASVATSHPSKFDQIVEYLKALYR